MKRPSRVRIIGKLHKIDYLPADHRDLKDGDDALVGRIDHDAQRVMIAQGQTLVSEQDTLLHEVLHGVEWAMDLEVPETVIHRLATGLLAVLKDNPDFLRYLAR